MPQGREDFQQLLQSSFPIIIAETHDEQTVTRMLESIVNSCLKTGPLHVWSAVKGLEGVLERNTREWTVEGLETKQDKASLDTSDPEAALKYIKENMRSGVILLPDFHAYLTNPAIVRMVKEIAHDYNLRPITLVFVSHSIDVPPEIERLAAHFDMSVPDEKRIRKLLSDEVKVWRLKQNNKKLQADMKTVDLLVNNLVGLTESDVKRLIQGAIYDDHAITHSDIDEVMQAKYRMISRGGALQFEYDTARFNDLAGFKQLKSWLELRKPFFVGSPAGDIDVPKGILLLGVQGCGKSLAANAVAGAWGVPLLRLDIGALFNKFIGESERNVREALQSADVLAPCVLWIDEI
ncbi:MAG: AAA family ATPase, partial [Pseudomonadota bacterium]